MHDHVTFKTLLMHDHGNMYESIWCYRAKSLICMLNSSRNWKLKIEYGSNHCCKAELHWDRCSCQK